MSDSEFSAADAVDDESDEMCFAAVHYDQRGPRRDEHAPLVAAEIQRCLRDLSKFGDRLLEDDVRELEGLGYRLMRRFPMKRVRGPNSRCNLRVPFRYETMQLMFGNGKNWYCLNFARRKLSSSSSSSRTSLSRSYSAVSDEEPETKEEMLERIDREYAEHAKEHGLLSAAQAAKADENWGW